MIAKGDYYDDRLQLQTKEEEEKKNEVKQRNK